jgi:hypothetical protein
MTAIWPFYIVFELSLRSKPPEGLTEARISHAPAVAAWSGSPFIIVAFSKLPDILAEAT